MADLSATVEASLASPNMSEGEVDAASMHRVPVAEQVVCLDNMRALQERVSMLVRHNLEHQHRLGELQERSVTRVEFEAQVGLKEDRGVSTAGFKHSHRTTSEALSKMCSLERLEELLLGKVDTKNFKKRVVSTVQLDLKRLFDVEMNQQVDLLRTEFKGLISSLLDIDPDVKADAQQVSRLHAELTSHKKETMRELLDQAERLAVLSNKFELENDERFNRRVQILEDRNDVIVKDIKESGQAYHQEMMGRIDEVEGAVLEKHGDVVDRIQQDGLRAIKEAQEAMTSEVDAFKSKIRKQYHDDIGNLGEKVGMCEQLCDRAGEAVADAYNRVKDMDVKIKEQIKVASTFTRDLNRVTADVTRCEGDVVTLSDTVRKQRENVAEVARKHKSLDALAQRLNTETSRMKESMTTEFAATHARLDAIEAEKAEGARELVAQVKKLEDGLKTMQAAQKRGAATEKRSLMMDVDLKIREVLDSSSGSVDSLASKMAHEVKELVVKLSASKSDMAKQVAAARKVMEEDKQIVSQKIADLEPQVRAAAQQAEASSGQVAKLVRNMDDTRKSSVRAVSEVERVEQRVRKLEGAAPKVEKREVKQEEKKLPSSDDVAHILQEAKSGFAAGLIGLEGALRADLAEHTSALGALKAQVGRMAVMGPPSAVPSTLSSSRRQTTLGLGGRRTSFASVARAASAAKSHQNSRRGSLDGQVNFGGEHGEPEETATPPIPPTGLLEEEGLSGSEEASDAGVSRAVEQQMNAELHKRDQQHAAKHTRYSEQHDAHAKAQNLCETRVQILENLMDDMLKNSRLQSDDDTDDDTDETEEDARETNGITGPLATLRESKQDLQVELLAQTGPAVDTTVRTSSPATSLEAAATTPEPPLAASPVEPRTEPTSATPSVKQPAKQLVKEAAQETAEPSDVDVGAATATAAPVVVEKNGDTPKPRTEKKNQGKAKWQKSIQAAVQNLQRLRERDAATGQLEASKGVDPGALKRQMDSITMQNGAMMRRLDEADRQRVQTVQDGTNVGDAAMEVMSTKVASLRASDEATCGRIAALEATLGDSVDRNARSMVERAMREEREEHGRSKQQMLQERQKLHKEVEECKVLAGDLALDLTRGHECCERLENEQTRLSVTHTRGKEQLAFMSNQMGIAGKVATRLEAMVAEGGNFVLAHKQLKQQKQQGGNNNSGGGGGGGSTKRGRRHPQVDAHAVPTHPEVHASPPIAQQHSGAPDPALLAWFQHWALDVENALQNRLQLLQAPPGGWEPLMARTQEVGEQVAQLQAAVHYGGGSPSVGSGGGDSVGSPNGTESRMLNRLDAAKHSMQDDMAVFRSQMSKELRDTVVSMTRSVAIDKEEVSFKAVQVRDLLQASEHRAQGLLNQMRGLSRGGSRAVVPELRPAQAMEGNGPPPSQQEAELAGGGAIGQQRPNEVAELRANIGQLQKLVVAVNDRFTHECTQLRTQLSSAVLTAVAAPRATSTQQYAPGATAAGLSSTAPVQFPLVSNASKERRNDRANNAKEFRRKRGASLRSSKGYLELPSTIAPSSSSSSPSPIAGEPRRLHKSGGKAASTGDLLLPTQSTGPPRSQGSSRASSRGRGGSRGGGGGTTAVNCVPPDDNAVLEGWSAAANADDGYAEGDQAGGDPTELAQVV